MKTLVIAQGYGSYCHQLLKTSKDKLMKTLWFNGTNIPAKLLKTSKDKLMKTIPSANRSRAQFAPLLKTSKDKLMKTT